MRERLRRAAGRRVTVGFDGFIDTIARPVVCTATADAPAQYFASIPDFGQYLVEHGGKSCSIALHVERRQLGGNLPHLSHAAGVLGLDVSCVGMLGLPEIDPVFSDLPCKLYSFAPAGDATALEFADGKVFLAADPVPSTDPWQDVCAHVPQAARLFGEAELIALVNWSELDLSQALWQAVFDHAVAPQPTDFSRFAFFDLCDCTRRSAEQLHEVLRLLGCFATRRTVVLSLNENEALDCGRKVLGGLDDLSALAAALAGQYGIQQVLIHTIRETILHTPDGLTREGTRFVAQPRISTGAGDHFNGASCFALLAGLSDRERVHFASVFASVYVAKGSTPTLGEVLEVL